MSWPLFTLVDGCPYIIDADFRTMRRFRDPDDHWPMPELQPQEIPFDHPRSCCRFCDKDKPFLMSSGAVKRFDYRVICGCLAVLQELAKRHDGIDSQQVFVDDRGERLWFIEDGEIGVIRVRLSDER